jgi:hypothetical protein
MIQRDDLPPTPDWSFTPVDMQQPPSLVMPLRFEGDDG